jgi:hypothetical protein
MFMTADARVRVDGGKYGSRNSAVAVGCAHSNNHPTRSVLALIEGTARMVSAPVSGRAETLGAGEAGHTLESSTSAISWAAVIG